MWELGGHQVLFEQLTLSQSLPTTVRVRARIYRPCDDPAMLYYQTFWLPALATAVQGMTSIDMYDRTNKSKNKKKGKGNKKSSRFFFKMELCSRTLAVMLFLKSCLSFCNLQKARQRKKVKLIWLPLIILAHRLVTVRWKFWPSENLSTNYSSAWQWLRSVSWNFRPVLCDWLKYLWKFKISVALALWQTIVQKYTRTQDWSSWFKWLSTYLEHRQ